MQTKCERSFSTMRRIKTYTRNRTADDRLSNLSLLTIEKELTKQINIDEIVDKFIKSGRRRMAFVKVKKFD